MRAAQERNSGKNEKFAAGVKVRLTSAVSLIKKTIEGFRGHTRYVDIPGICWKLHIRL